MDGALTNSELARKAAAVGDSHFHGSMCKCGSTLRYVNHKSHACVKCNNARSAKRRAEKPLQSAKENKDWNIKNAEYRRAYWRATRVERFKNMKQGEQFTHNGTGKVATVIEVVAAYRDNPKSAHANFKRNNGCRVAYHYEDGKRLELAKSQFIKTHKPV